MQSIKRYAYANRFALMFVVFAVAVLLIDPTGNLAHALPLIGFAGTTENLLGTCITNRDAVPAVINDGRLERGVLKEASDTVTTTSGKTTGSTYRLCSVPSTARVSQVILNAAAMTAGAFDIGVYRNTKDGGAVVSAALFGSAVDCAAAVVDVDVTGESTTYTNAKRQQPLWQAAGLTADPGGTLDIVATSTSTITAGAALGLRVRYCDNGA